MGNQRAVRERKQLQFPPRYGQAWQEFTIKSVSRILSCGRVSENQRGPTKSHEVRAPVVECRDGLARITLEELAITHSVKDGILQNACTTRTMSGCRFGEKCSFVRLTHSRRNGPNRIMTKALWLY